MVERECAFPAAPFSFLIKALCPKTDTKLTRLPPEEPSMVKDAARVNSMLTFIDCLFVELYDIWCLVSEAIITLDAHLEHFTLMEKCRRWENFDVHRNNLTGT